MFAEIQETIYSDTPLYKGKNIQPADEHTHIQNNPWNHTCLKEEFLSADACTLICLLFTETIIYIGERRKGNFDELQVQDYVKS